MRSGVVSKVEGSASLKSGAFTYGAVPITGMFICLSLAPVLDVATLLLKYGILLSIIPYFELQYILWCLKETYKSLGRNMI